MKEITGKGHAKAIKEHREDNRELNLSIKEHRLH